MSDVWVSIGLSALITVGVALLLFLRLWFFLKVVGQRLDWLAALCGDQRVSNVVVTDARGGFAEIRFLVSAKKSSKQWDVRCAVREHRVGWLHKNHAESFPPAHVAVEQKDQPRKAVAKR